MIKVLVQRFTQNSLLFILLFTLFFFLAYNPAETRAAVNKNINLPNIDTNFPLYPIIKPNVDFWVRIFSKTSKSQCLIHDNRNLGIVYDTINIDSSGTSRARKKNRKIKKKAIKRYKTILLNLANGKTPSTKQEKKVATIFGDKATAKTFKNAAYNIRIQTGVKEDFRAGLIRSGAYLENFQKVFKSHGLPVDLAYLPCVESSFQYKAYSKFGAAGIWQFTRSTGRLFMEVGYVVDERRDPYISTNAAAKLLKKNYGELREWPLAITAYNHGLNGMMRAKKSKKSYERIFQSYKSRSFKFASRNFYSEFLAACIVAKNYKTYFGTLSLEKPRSFQTVTTKGFLPVKAVSDKLSIPMETLKVLNPALRQPVFKGQKYIPKNFKLKLPSIFSKKAAANKLAALYKNKQKPSLFHRVQKGDTAGAIARLHSVHLHDLIMANGLSRRATIYVGQNLRIPVKGERIEAKRSVKLPKISSSTVSPRVKKALIKATPQSLPKKAIEKPQVSKVLATQKTQKTLSAPKPTKAIAEVPAIEQKNQIPVNPNIVTSNLKVLKAWEVSGKTIGTIRIEAEETLGHYADWLNIKTNAIRTLNRLKYGSPISIDQTIKLPMHKKTIREFEEQRYEFHKEMEEDFFESFSIQAIETYEIKKGENIWYLCLNKLEIPFWLLKKYNPDTNFQTLIPNQKINYPIVVNRI